MADLVLIALLALAATSILFFDPFKTPTAFLHRREAPLVPYSFARTFLVILVIFEGGWVLLQALPAGTDGPLP